MSKNSTGDHPTAARGAAMHQGATVVDTAVAADASKVVGTQRGRPGAPLAGRNTPSLFNMKNKAFSITGGGRGIGLTVAAALLECSAAYIQCMDVLPEPDPQAWKLAQETASKYGGKIEYAQVDATKEDQMRQAIEHAYGRPGQGGQRMDGFFVAAGIQQMVPAYDYPIADFRRIIDVNTTGAFVSIQAAARQMRAQEQPGGAIAITASMSGSVANKGLQCIAYNTSKSALLQMARNAAMEWGKDGIRVNTLSPGYIRTAMTDALLAERPDFEEEWLRGSLLDRLATPDEFRGPATFLLSDASSFMTGADLRVDGGHCAT